MLEDAAREFVEAQVAYEENQHAHDWIVHCCRRDAARATLWAACGRVEGWPELEPENAT